MLIVFPPAPTLEGLSYLNVMPVFFTDHGSGQRLVFPVYHYRDNESGELVLVTEDHFEPILDRLIVAGTFSESGDSA